MIAALDQLGKVRTKGGDVALLITDQWMPEMTGLDFLAQAHAIYPDTKRALLIDVGDVTAEQVHHLWLDAQPARLLLG